MQIEIIENRKKKLQSCGARDSKEDFSYLVDVTRRKGFIEFEFVMKKKKGKEKNTIDIAQTARDFRVSVAAVVRPIKCYKSLLAINSSR